MNNGGGDKENTPVMVTQENVAVPQQWHCVLRAFGSTDWIWTKFNLKWIQCCLVRPRHSTNAQKYPEGYLLWCLCFRWGNEDSEILRCPWSHNWDVPTQFQICSFLIPQFWNTFHCNWHAYLLISFTDIYWPWASRDNKIAWLLKPHSVLGSTTNPPFCYGEPSQWW